MNQKVDLYIEKLNSWKEETIILRKIILECGFDEDIKWGKPCYSFNNHNLVVIQGFKSYFALLFFTGFALKDPENILQKTGENTRVGRQIRFNNVQEILEKKDIIKSYLFEAIELDKSGVKQVYEDKPDEIIIPELQEKFDSDLGFKNAFEKLTPGRRRAYLIHFSQAKQSATRKARIEKWTINILQGKGLNE